MSGRQSRDTGARVERGVEAALQAAGLVAVRVLLSGAAGGRFSGDEIMHLPGATCALKARVHGFRKLYHWPQDRDALIFKGDRQEPLVVVRLSVAAASLAQIGTETKQ